MVFNTSNARNTRKLLQKNRWRRCRRLLIQSLQEGGMCRVCVWKQVHCKQYSSITTIVTVYSDKD